MLSGRNNNMSGVTIPRRMHQEVVEAFKREYEAEFGELTDAARRYSREQLAAKYAADLRFWEARVPQLDLQQRPSLETVCRHLVTTNAVANLKRAMDGIAHH